MTLKPRPIKRHRVTTIEEPTEVEFFSSGSKLLDLALGGGWAERRIGNVIGDRSSGKTLLMIEAATNFALKYPHGKIRYRESEAAFSESYAATLGMPMDRVDFGSRLLETVEDLFEDLQSIAEHAHNPELCINDSLDALSSRSEMSRAIDASSYHMEKAKLMSELFRRLTKPMAANNVTLLIVSQVRDDINAKFGRKTKRSGGRALDFYASQVLYLAQTGIIKRTINGIERPVGIQIKAKCDKNKLGLPFREAEFPILFQFGIDDASACIDWLKNTGGLGDVLGELKEKAFISMIRDGQSGWKRAFDHLHQYVEQRWNQIEHSFLPPRKKYGDA